MRTFARVVEEYLGDLRRLRVSVGATGERWGYGPLANLLNEIGGGVRVETTPLRAQSVENPTRPQEASTRKTSK